jgi:hypothetical protein
MHDSLKSRFNDANGVLRPDNLSSPGQFFTEYISSTRICNRGPSIFHESQDASFVRPRASILVEDKCDPKTRIFLIPHGFPYNRIRLRNYDRAARQSVYSRLAGYDESIEAPSFHCRAERRNTSPRHLGEKVPVSDLCDEYGIQPSLFYTWQRQLPTKASVIAEISEEYVELKTTLGES